MLAPGAARPENDFMKADDIERVAYIAAHRILMADTSARELACPGARRSRAVDAIAGIIKEVFELSTLQSDYCAERDNSSADIVELLRTAVVLELPRHASSRSDPGRDASHNKFRKWSCHKSFVSRQASGGERETDHEPST